MYAYCYDMNDMMCPPYLRNLATPLWEIFGHHELFSDADDQLFLRTSHIQAHVLKPLLPANTQHSYNLQDRSHSYSLINKDAHINDRYFIVRLLYKHAY